MKITPGCEGCRSLDFYQKYYLRIVETDIKQICSKYLSYVFDTFPLPEAVKEYHERYTRFSNGCVCKTCLIKSTCEGACENYIKFLEDEYDLTVSGFQFSSDKKCFIITDKVPFEKLRKFIHKHESIYYKDKK